jgi:hypothetical protein
MTNVEFEHEVTSRKEAFQFISDISEMFPSEPCGCCGKENTRPMVRKHDSYVFYEIACGDCGAKLSFGQHKEGGGLFLKRWDKEKNQPLPSRGWAVYKKDGKDGGKPAYQSQAEDRHPKDETGSEVPF